MIDWRDPEDLKRVRGVVMTVIHIGFLVVCLVCLVIAVVLAGVWALSGRPEAVIEAAGVFLMGWVVAGLSALMTGMV